MQTAQVLPTTVSNRGDTPASRGIAALMAFEAATLAIMSTLHLTAVIHGGSKPFKADDAGIAEAIICVVLAGGAAALLLAGRRGRSIALGTSGFAVLGFIVGLTITVQGAGVLDVAYHATMLPVLAGTAILLARSGATREQS